MKKLEREWFESDIEYGFYETAYQSNQDTEEEKIKTLWKLFNHCIIEKGCTEEIVRKFEGYKSLTLEEVGFIQNVYLSMKSYEEEKKDGKK